MAYFERRESITKLAFIARYSLWLRLTQQHLDLFDGQVSDANKLEDLIFSGG